jgi:hypothetical protein
VRASRSPDEPVGAIPRGARRKLERERRGLGVISSTASPVLWQRAPRGRQLNHRLPPDALDWDAWLDGDDMYFFLGPCRACGRPVHFEGQEAWDLCRSCTRKREGDALWAVLPG